MDDDASQPPLTGGIFRRIARGRTGTAMSFALVEELFAPSRHEARRQVEEQQRVGKPAPAPTDPPGLSDPAGVPDPTGLADPARLADPTGLPTAGQSKSKIE